MPRYGPFIHQVHIADGFADDCDELIHQCLKLENLNYQSFCTVWKKMNMGCLYKGRTLGAEVAELSEEVIQIAKHYMVRDTSNFEESVAGLFIVYALLNLQPYPGFAHLRLTAEDLPAIDRIELVARREKRQDVLYILASVLIKGPVHYCATDREYGMDLAIRKYLEGFTSIDKLGLRPKGVFYRQNEELDIIRELDTITQRYTQAKMEISETAEFDRNLRYIDNNLSKDLEASLKKLISGIHEDQYGSQETKEDDDKVLKKRKAIKERAMKGEVQPVMHLTDLKDRKMRAAGTSITQENAGTSSTSPKKSPKKSTALTTNSAKVDYNRKRRIPISPRAFKQSRNLKENNTKDMCTESDDTESEHNESDSDIEGTSSQELDNLQASCSKESEKDKDKEPEEGIEQELDIEIDTLPVIIRSENQGRKYEIEIIALDNDGVPIKHSPVVQTYQRKKTTALTKISELPGLSIKKIDDAVPTDNAEIVVIPAEPQQSDLANIIEIKNGKDEKGGKSKKKKCQKPKEKTPGISQPEKGENSNKKKNKNTKEKTPGIPKPEKRDMKRAHIQSKFKRQGMLPVANFEPSETIESDDNMDEASTAAEESFEGLDAIED